MEFDYKEMIHTISSIVLADIYNTLPKINRVLTEKTVAADDIIFEKSVTVFLHTYDMLKKSKLDKYIQPHFLNNDPTLLQHLDAISDFLLTCLEKRK